MSSKTCAGCSSGATLRRFEETFQVRTFGRRPAPQGRQGAPTWRLGVSTLGENAPKPQRKPSDATNDETCPKGFSPALVPLNPKASNCNFASTRRGRIGALVAGVGLAWGCGSSVELQPGRGDAGADAPPSGDAGQPDCHDPVVGCTAHGERQCLKLADCGKTPLSFEACEAMWRDFCLSRLVIPNSSFDACDFAACPDLEHTDCYQSCPLSHREGTRPVGASCRFSLSCATGYCAQSTDASCGTCQPKLGPDEGCGSSGLCAPGLACYKTAGETASTCRPELPLGAACLPTEECSNLLTCSFGVCSLPPSKGEPCDGKGLHSCAYPWLCLDGVCASGSTSAPSPGLGEPCTESCRLGALCEAGICQLAALSGEPCVNDEAAPANQRCASYPGFGCIDGICKWKPLIDGCSP